MTYSRCGNTTGTMTQRDSSNGGRSEETKLVHQLKTKQPGSSIELRAFECNNTIEIAVKKYQFILICQNKELGQRPEEKFKISGTIQIKTLGDNTGTSYILLENVKVLEAGDTVDIRDEERKSGERLFTSKSQDSDGTEGSEPTKTISRHISGGNKKSSPVRKRTSQPNPPTRCSRCGAIVQGRHQCYAKGTDDDYDPDNPGSIY